MVSVACDPVVGQLLLPEAGGSLFVIEVWFELYGAHCDCPMNLEQNVDSPALSTRTGTLVNRMKREQRASFQPTTAAHCVFLSGGPETGPRWG